MARQGLGEGFEAVLAAARTGADWAWTRIYDDLAGAVLGYLRARGAPDADDVLGEVFAQLVRDINRFEGDEFGFRSWVFVIAHHRLLDDLRRRGRRPEHLSAPEDLRGAVDPSDVEEGAVRRQTEAELRELIETLTPDQRDVILMRVFGGLKVDEIAVALGKRGGAVKALQRRGLEVLKSRLVARGYPSGAAGR